MENKKRSQLPLTKKLINFAYQSRALRIGRSLFAKSLTVVNYHRIGDPQAEPAAFIPNISARPKDFDLQMEYLKRWFNVITVQDVVDWLKTGRELPPYAALITFDDGYLDNYTEAYPILRKHNLPAVIFLTHGHIGTDAPFYWDLAAYCFYHTDANSVLFPGGETQSWADEGQRTLISRRWIEALKILPHVEKLEWVEKLPERLRVSIPQNYFKNLMMNWDQVREMSRHGIEFGGHTLTHPILTRVPLEQAEREIRGSKLAIEQELGREVHSFAYPNGQKDDVNAAVESLAQKSGYQAAFTLQNGPTTLREVKRNPFAIRRIFISHAHTLPKFALLTHRINRYRD
ncbi:MAG: polysaccharide deacetylase family protein [Anaerolineales bacterium]|nr:polysaccharide deacetylase family protein [Anaerolineales bacterium]